jgi:hypothetical protein
MRAIDGDCAVADGEFHGAGDGGAAGLGCGRAGGGLDLGEDGVDAWGGGFADPEFAEGGADVVLESSAVGIERGRRPLAVGDKSLEALLPEVEEMVDLVECAELAGAVVLGAVLELAEELVLRGALGAAGGGDVAQVAVVVAKVGLGQVAGGLAFGVGLVDPGRDASPSPDGQWWPRHVMPPTGAMVGCSDARGPARYEVAVTVRNSVM